jgi:predicted Zn-dependent peptidase
LASPDKMEFDTFTLPNGLRVLHKQDRSPVAHCALIINAGSRDEGPHQEGLAHFIEHMLFKGTQKRKAYHILSRLDDVGGELNAFTGKEETTLYTAFLSEFYPRALELLFDISFQSVFPEKELAKEKDVVLEEISSYMDSPSELIFDDFETLIFKGHPIGRHILGTPESVKGLTREDVTGFIHGFYNPEQMVLASVGNLSPAKFKQLAEKYAGHFPANKRLQNRKPLNGYHAENLTTPKDTFQAHLILGNRAYDMRHKRARTLILLNNLLGGPGMNSRLNLNIREKYGFAYNIESFYTPYTDTGIFGVYAGTDHTTIDKTLTLIHRELKLLREKPLGTLQLAKAKKQLMGQIALAQESNGSLMLSLGKSLLHFNRVDTLKQVYDKIEAITVGDVQDVAQEVFDPKQLSLLTYTGKS